MCLLAVVPVASAGSPLVIGLPTCVGNGPLYLARGKGFFKDQGLKVDLKGKAVAYKIGSASEWFLVHLLKKPGLSIKDIKSVNMEPGSAGTPFITGKVDAAVTWEPYLNRGKTPRTGIF